MWRSSRFLKILLFGILCIGCVEKSDPYPDPSQGGDGEPGAGTTLVSISYLKGYYTGYPTPITKDWELQGVVTANDRYGTFPYGLVVQDATGGIEIKLSGDDLFLTYPIGQPIRIRCQGLVLGAYGGYVTLGSVSSDADYQNGFISQTDISGRLSKRGEIEPVLPDTLRFAELEPKHVGCFVAFEMVQFVDEELGLTWCDEDSDSNRHLVNVDGDTLLVRTSRYARFADDVLPVGSGYVEGILEWFNNSYQLRVIDARNVIMESSRF